MEVRLKHDMDTLIEYDVWNQLYESYLYSATLFGDLKWELRWK